MIVAIDGPAGSGKSTTARLVAQKLGFKYIDTGATYRAMALAVIRNKIDPLDEMVVERLASEFVVGQGIKALPTQCMIVEAGDTNRKPQTANRKPQTKNQKEKRYMIDFRGGKVFLSNEDITQAIRDEEVGKIASLCSTYKGVRENMVTLQRELANGQNVVCEGRDIGTVVFPDAGVKIYITASLRERAKRRMHEQGERGVHKLIDDVERDLGLRDLQDSKREHSPLRIPEGALIIDTTNLSIDEEVEAVIKIILNTKC